MRMMKLKAEEDLHLLNLLKVSSGLVDASDARQFERELRGRAEVKTRSKGTVNDLLAAGIGVEHG